MSGGATATGSLEVIRDTPRTARRGRFSCARGVDQRASVADYRQNTRHVRCLDLEGAAVKSIVWRDKAGLSGPGTVQKWTTCVSWTSILKVSPKYATEACRRLSQNYLSRISQNS